MQPKGNMIVDIGGGTTEIVIALGGIRRDKSVKLLVTFSQMTLYYMRTQHFVGESTAENKKPNRSSIEDLETPEDMSVQGRDLLTVNQNKLRFL
jgi:rod shape-determining protein MreB